MSKENGDVEDPQTDTSPLKEISKEKLKNILVDHRNWLRTDGKEGKAACLNKTNLRGAVLLGADLQKADFKETYLYGAYLKNANLKKADLSGANLRGANLRWANLEQANLKKTNLVRADLQGTNLEKADLRGANLKMAAGLTPEQIEKALIDDTTVIPKEGLR